MKHRVRSSFAVAAVAIFFVCTLAIPGELPTELESGIESSVGTEGADPMTLGQPGWGLGYSSYFIPAAEFVPRSSDCEIQYKGLGYLYTTAGSGDNGCLWAPLLLPAGSFLHGLRLFYYDNYVGDSIGFLVTRYYGETTVGYANLFWWDSTGEPGYASYYGLVEETIRYQPVFNDVDSEQGYVVIVCPRTNSSNLAFKGVRITYQLQISPAPAVATFNDVPLGAFGFQHVEALVASGITAGCGGGNFCPNQPLTRVQMAVFLAKALGLHWDR